VSHQPALNLDYLSLRLWLRLFHRLFHRDIRSLLNTKLIENEIRSKLCKHGWLRRTQNNQDKKFLRRMLDSLLNKSTVEVGQFKR